MIDLSSAEITLLKLWSFCMFWTQIQFLFLFFFRSPHFENSDQCNVIKQKKRKEKKTPGRMQLVHGEQKLHMADFRSLGNVPPPLPARKTRMCQDCRSLSGNVPPKPPPPKKSGWVKFADHHLAMYPVDG